MDAVLLDCLDHIAASTQTIKKHNEALKAGPSIGIPQYLSIHTGGNLLKIFTRQIHEWAMGISKDRS